MRIPLGQRAALDVNPIAIVAVITFVALGLSTDARKTVSAERHQAAETSPDPRPRSISRPTGLQPTRGRNAVTVTAFVPTTE